MFVLIHVYLFFLITVQLDRFIPNRSAMDFDYAHYMLTEGYKGTWVLSSKQKVSHVKVKKQKIVVI